MIKEEFVPYEESLTLKELGLDIGCMTYYEDDNHFVEFTDGEDEWHNSILGDFVAAPTYRQAFNWIRREYGLHSFFDIYPTTEEPERCWYMIRFMDRERDDEDYMSGWFVDQDKATLPCLRKLIEIVEDGKE